MSDHIFNVVTPTEYNQIFHKLYENANIGIFVFTAWKQKDPVIKC